MPPSAQAVVRKKSLRDVDMVVISEYGLTLCTERKARTGGAAQFLWKHFPTRQSLVAHQAA
jgi:hypothetical protein